MKKENIILRDSEKGDTSKFKRIKESQKIIEKTRLAEMACDLRDTREAEIRNKSPHNKPIIPLRKRSGFGCSSGKFENIR